MGRLVYHSYDIRDTLFRPLGAILSSLQQLEIGLIGIGKMLSDGPWAVPVYQRAYAWEEKHVQDLFRDIDGAIAHDEQEYFLGSIVITNTGSNAPSEIVDGQQRLATITILIAAVRDYFCSRADTARAHDIEREYLFDTDLRTQEINPKLRLNNADHDFFAQTILQKPGQAIPQSVRIEKGAFVLTQWAELRKQ